MTWQRALRWGEYALCAVLVCAASEIAFERWVIADVVGPIVADVPRPEPLPGHVATRMNAFVHADFPGDSGQPLVLPWIVRESLREEMGRRRTRCGTFSTRVARVLVSHHGEMQGMLRWHLRNFLTMLWVRSELSPDERLAIFAEEGWFGAGNLRESAAALLGKDVDDVTAGELAYLLAWNDVGGSGRHLVPRRAFILDEFLNAGVIGTAEFEAETASRGLPEYLAEKVLTCPKPPECASNDDT